MPRRLSAILLALLLLAAPGLGPGGRALANPQVDDAGLLAAHGFRPGDVGYTLFDLANGRRLLERNEKALFIPASVVKLPTALAAIGILGAGHRFETTVLATSAPVDGVVDGDLFLRGGGNPLLFTEDLEHLVLTLKAAGVRRVAGDFHYDASSLQPLEQIEPSQPHAAVYNTAVSALTLNFNRVQVRWEPNKRGQTLAEARAVSRTRALPLDRISFGAAASAIPGAPFVLADATGGERWLLSPGLARKGNAWLPVRDPGAAAAEVFRDLAQMHGIDLPPGHPGAAPMATIPLARHLSDPLEDISRLVLKYSNNLAAELVGLSASQRLVGEPLDLLHSSTALTGWLRRALPDADWSGFFLANHSGLSSASRASPEQMADIVRYALSSVHGGADFAELLPPIRWEDEVNEQKDAGAADLRVRAKTGTMSYARGLAGYLQTASGRMLGFALFLTDLDARAALDAAADPRVLASPPAAREWTARARKLERALVSEWLLAF